jgi:hypothetical protein
MTVTQLECFLAIALSGWGIAGVTTPQAGLPMTLTDALGGAAYGYAGVSRAQICPGFTDGQIITPGSMTSKLNNYFNLNSLADTASTVGSSTGMAIPAEAFCTVLGRRTGTFRSSRGPGLEAYTKMRRSSFALKCTTPSTIRNSTLPVLRSRLPAPLSA